MKNGKKRTRSASLAVLLAALLLSSACGEANAPDAQIFFSGMTLKNGTTLVTDDGGSDLIEGLGLIVVNLPEGSEKPAAGSGVSYVIEDRLGELYPPHAWAVSFEVGDESKSVKTSLEIAERIREHDPSNTVIIDVRTAEEFAAGHVPSALLLPLADLPGNLPDYPSDTNIIVYCRSGNRSATAADILHQAGFKIVIDAGGILGYAGEIIVPSD